MPKNNILIIVAHPDDEVIGCGGTAARLAEEGHKVFTLILGEGITSRYQSKKRIDLLDKLDLLKEQAAGANKALGIKKVLFMDFPDNKFDTVPFLDIVQSIENIKNTIKPSVVFTHFKGDLNIDHRITFDAVLTAFRPLPTKSPVKIYSFEVLSSTEWNYPVEFYPNVFFDISSTVKKKIRAMEQYKSEMKTFPHPRSDKSIRARAENVGTKCGLKCAEQFMMIREIL